MNSVINNENTIIIKNSKFICLIYQVNNIKEIEEYLKKVKTEYKNATHYCYAYILNTTSKYSDDKEPQGTAGIPMLEVLKKNNLNNVLCIVIRYFGKILLGSSGLIRAYTTSVKECLKDHIIILKPGYNITITFNYEDLKTINHLLNDSKILTKKFEKKITYNINIDNNIYKKINNIKNCEIKINKNIYL